MLNIKGRIKRYAIAAGVAFLVNNYLQKPEPVEPVMEHTVALINDAKLWKDYQNACENQTYSTYNDPANTECRDIEVRKVDDSIDWRCISEKRNGVQTGNYHAETAYK